MLEYLQSVLLTKCELDPRLPILVGVSGGPDSLCLLDGLHRLGFDLIVAHLDHRLRPESLEEARAVESMAGDRDLPFILEYENVNQYAIQQGNSVEEAARILRYRFLFRVAAAQNFQAVVVGHTADDQAETVLMHLLRGAGLDGLKGMTYRSLPNAWSDTIPLVRPLLGAWRDEIMAYINAKDLHPLEDASNLDTRFYRNRLRNELIPYLEGLNPGVRGRLWRMADILAEDHNVLEKITEDIWNACLQESGAGYLAIGLQTLADQPLGVRRRLVRRAISMLRPGLRDIDYAAVNRALDFISAPSTSGQVDLIAGLRMVVEGQRLWLAAWEADLPDRDWPQLTPGALLDLDIPGELDLGSGWMLRAGLVEDTHAGRAQALNNADPYQAWLDLDELQVPLSVRSRRPGDRFEPLGMGGETQKLADFMVNVKLPRRARDGWPLVCSGDEVAWVPGYRLAHPFKLGDQTARLSHIMMLRSST